MREGQHHGVATRRSGDVVRGVLGADPHPCQLDAAEVEVDGHADPPIDDVLRGRSVEVRSVIDGVARANDADVRREADAGDERLSAVELPVPGVRSRAEIAGGVIDPGVDAVDGRADEDLAIVVFARPGERGVVAAELETRRRRDPRRVTGEADELEVGAHRRREADRRAEDADVRAAWRVIGDPELSGRQLVAQRDAAIAVVRHTADRSGKLRTRLAGKCAEAQDGEAAQDCGFSVPSSKGRYGRASTHTHRHRRS